MALILDANLVVLYVVGSVDRELIARHKRLSSFTAEAFDMVQLLVDGSSSLLVTPHVLAEAANVSVFGLTGATQSNVRALLRDPFLPLIDERHVAADVATGDPCYQRLGLTDAAIAQLAEAGHEVLTVDFELYRHLLERGITAHNFTHWPWFT